MIQSTELIGRWFLYGKHYVKPLTFHNPQDSGGYCDCEYVQINNTLISGLGIVKASDLLPIHLSVEVLKKCGFVKIEVLRFCIGNFSIHQNGKKLYYKTDSYNIQMTSVHQLQNLYFALTGKELQINL